MPLEQKTVSTPEDLSSLVWLLEMLTSSGEILTDKMTHCEIPY